MYDWIWSETDQLEAEEQHHRRRTAAGAVPSREPAVVITIPDESGLAVWEGEGGSLGLMSRPQRPHARRARRAPQDTAEGCMAMARADMARAAEAQSGWPRIRFEHSAVAWSRRADLLDTARKERVGRPGHH